MAELRDTGTGLRSTPSSSLIAALQEADETLVKVGALDQARAVRDALAVLQAVDGATLDFSGVLHEKLADALSGLRYIEQRYGRLDGVGWERVLGV